MQKGPKAMADIDTLYARTIEVDIEEKNRSIDDTDMKVENIKFLKLRKKRKLLIKIDIMKSNLRIFFGS